MLPVVGSIVQALAAEDSDKDMRRLKGIIDAMTPEEQRSPSELVDRSRRLRIAARAGVEPREIQKLVKDFEGMDELMRRISGPGMHGRTKLMQESIRRPSPSEGKRLRGLRGR